MNPLRPCPHREILPGPLATLPPAVDEALRQETRAGAQRAQATLDALGVTEALYRAIARKLSQQPGTIPFWRRWWATWRGGVLLAGQPA